MAQSQRDPSTGSLLRCRVGEGLKNAAGEESRRSPPDLARLGHTGLAARPEHWGFWCKRSLNVENRTVMKLGTAQRAAPTAAQIPRSHRLRRELAVRAARPAIRLQGQDRRQQKIPTNGPTELHRCRHIAKRAHLIPRDCVFGIRFLPNENSSIRPPPHRRRSQIPDLKTPPKSWVLDKRKVEKKLPPLAIQGAKLQSARRAVDTWHCLCRILCESFVATILSSEK